MSSDSKSEKKQKLTLKQAKLVADRDLKLIGY